MDKVNCTGSDDQNHPKEKEMQEGKVVVSGNLYLTKEEPERKGWGKSKDMLK